MNKALKVVLPILVIIGALVVSALLFLSRPKVERHPVEIKQPLVSVTPVYSKALSIPVSTRGTVTPGTEILLTSEVSGQVLSVSNHFANGGFFKKGETLIKVDDIEYQVNISRAKANVSKAKQAELQAKAEFKARSRVKGVKRDDYASGKAQWDQAKSSLQAARAELESAQLQKKRTIVKAPFDGRVRAKSVDVGQYIRPGAQLGTIYAVDVAEVRLPLSDRQLGLVDVPLRYREAAETEGTPVVLKGQYGGKSYEWMGRIVRAEGGLDEKNRLLYVVAQIEDPYARDVNQPDRPPLSAGTFVEAQIAGRYHQGVFTVPRRALRNGNQLWLVDADKRLFRRQVDVMYKGKNEIYVNGGLNNGEQVVLSQLDIAVEGMQVRTKLAAPLEQDDAPARTDDLMSGAVKVREQLLQEQRLSTVSTPPATRNSKSTSQGFTTDQISNEQMRAIAQQAKAAMDQMDDSTKRKLEDNVKNIVESVNASVTAINDVQRKEKEVETKPLKEVAEQETSTDEMSPLAALIAEDEAAAQTAKAKEVIDVDKTAGQPDIVQPVATTQQVEVVQEVASTTDITQAVAPRPLAEAAQ
ncbi:hypothetical protein A9Q81_24505 [Gammaproteobacteria bacterium 42_54_T18]|nr:hypothetical protein A9Q81_24505 [Gammaproteobacteria bacterium 42_54_T18]